MTLPSSGTLTTADVSQEIYGNTTTIVTIPGIDTRLLTGKASGPIVFPDDFYGTTWSPGTSSSHILTVGLESAFDTFYGYRLAAAIGNLAPNTLTPIKPSKVDALRYAVTGASLLFHVSVTAPATLNEAEARAAITSIIVDGNAFNISSATWTTISAQAGQFIWSTGSNPIGTTVGATKAVTVNYP